MRRTLCSPIVVLGLLLVTVAPAAVTGAAPPPGDPLSGAPTTAATPGGLGTNTRLDGSAAGSPAEDSKAGPAEWTTWQRFSHAADPDHDGHSAADLAGNYSFVTNARQADVGRDCRGDACDPLQYSDVGGDVPGGRLPRDPPDASARAAAIKWSRGTTHFVIRVDALSRFFQNEFTQILTDAAILSPARWAEKCWQDYEPADFTPAYQPCGIGPGTAGQTPTLPGGKQVPISLAVIPNQLWTDPPVIAWINDRNDYAELEIAQHGTYHLNNTPRGSWGSDPRRNFYPCETCGLPEAEDYELLRVGRDTLLGNYTNKILAASGATTASPRIDWSTAAHPLISYAPPYDASDTTSRGVAARLGFKSFSASVNEENSRIFSPEGSHMEQFDQFGMFHASARFLVVPPATPGDIFDAAAYRAYLKSITRDGGLNVWLIEEVDWSGRPCNNAGRLGTCNGRSNRENNTVYRPRWDAWMTLLDYVKNYPGGVVMTLGEVALAKAYQSAPAGSNAGDTHGRPP